MFFSEQLYITAHIMKTQGTKINLCCTKCYFTLSGDSRCCYRQKVKIIGCWKVISWCEVRKLLHKIGTEMTMLLEFVLGSLYDYTFF